MSYIASNYKAPKTIQEFHDDDSFVRGIVGPFGSSKSTAMCMEILKKGIAMPADSENRRRSKWAIIRATYPELMGTTLETWKKVLPESVLNFKLGNKEVPNCVIRMKLPDNTILDIKLEFYALDNPSMVDKLASFEFTGGWINEAREVPFAILGALTGRVGRFPSKMYDKNGVEQEFWSGIIMDTNPPDDDHWWYNLAENDKPNGYKFWRQPPALLKNDDGEYVPNPKAENIENLPKGYQYYYNMLAGKDEAWIKIYIQGEYGMVSHGKPVYPMFSEYIHVSDASINYELGHEVYAGIDYGFNSAIVFSQLIDGELKIINELYAENISTREFINEIVTPYVTNNLSEYKIIWVGDPSGASRSNVDGKSSQNEYINNGFDVSPCITNSVSARIQAVSSFLNNKKGMTISPECNVLIKGMRGNYCFERLNVMGERFKEKPTKNRYSHLCDALSYVCVMLDTTLNRPKRRHRLTKRDKIKWWI